MEITNAKQQHINIKGVIFDMDGLLFDSERLFFQHKQVVAQAYGYEETLEDYCKTLGMTGDALRDTMLAIHGADYPFAQISQAARNAMTNHLKTHPLPIKKGIAELLQFLSEQTIACAVASSTHCAYVRQYLKQSGLAHYFQAVIGGDMVPHSKPAPDIFLKAAEELMLSPSSCLVLEDSENGILAAYNAEIPVICIPDLKQPDEHVKKLVFALLPSAAELLNQLQHTPRS